MTKFFIIFKKTLFWSNLAHFSNFWGKKKLFQNIRLCHGKLHIKSEHHAKIQKIQMIPFQEKTRTHGMTEGQTDPILQEPFGYYWGSNKYNCSGLTFTYQSTEYDVVQIGCLHHSQHAKKSAQFTNSFLRLSRFQGFMN